VREGIAQADAGALVDFDDAFDRVSAKLKGMNADQP
jgi:predicted transcriptional regulator